MRKIHLTIFCVIAAIAVCTRICAQEDVLDLGEIVITAPGMSRADLLRELPGTAVVIERAEFEDRFTSVPELLESTPGV
jgi:hypothetical protein